MSAKQKKNKKHKRTPVRVISPQTVEMPSDEITKIVETEPVTVTQKPIPKYENKPYLLVGELKRIGIVFAVILLILVLASLIF